MDTYLLTWNPQRWDWKNIEDDIEEIQKTGVIKTSWSCGVTKKIKVGDRFFLIRLGKNSKGIIASGWVTSIPYRDIHWEDAKSGSINQTSLYVDIDFDVILHPDTVFPYSKLTKMYDEMHWSPQASGITIPRQIAEKFEIDWSDFLQNFKIFTNTIFPEEAETQQTFTEGAIKTVKVNYYERDSKAREVCINHYGFICSVCNFDFEAKYGEIGKGFIHVHHLKPLSEIGKEYKLNPINDLRPVCPNCHAMLHKRKPAFCIEELKTIIK